MTNTIEVTGCGDCPMWQRNTQLYTCNHPKRDDYGIDPFDTCPLKTNSIIIKLNDNERETESNSSV